MAAKPRRLRVELLEHPFLHQHPSAGAELGRGGRYICGEAEPATGLTLFPDSVLRAAPARQARERVFIPGGTELAAQRALRAAGFATVAALAAYADPIAEAHRLGCTHILRDGAAVPVPTHS